MFLLKNSNNCLILDPIDCHSLDNFSKGVNQLILALENYNIKDCIKGKILNDKI